MSIPIKTQLFGIGMTDGNETEWDGMLILREAVEKGWPECDYSYYGLRENKMHALSRSYAGQVIKQSLKCFSAEYHDLRYQANLAAKREDWRAVEEYREQAKYVKERAVIPLTNLWAKFRALRPAKPIKPDSRMTTTSLCADTRSKLSPPGIKPAPAVADKKRDIFKKLISK